MTLKLPPIGLGSWNTWDRMTPVEAAALVREAVDLGANLFDVAHYNFGPHAENATTDVLFGQAVREAGVGRQEYLLCGKLWLWDYPGAPLGPPLRTALDRIGVERADLVVAGDYLGRLDVRGVVSDVAALVADGLFTAWGVNNWPAADLGLAISFAREEGLVPPSFAQLKYNLARRSMAEGAPYRRLFADGLALQASDVLEGGILAGRPHPARKIGADPGGIRDGIRAALPAVRRAAAEFGVSPARLAVAFCLTHRSVANVLVGVTRREQLLDNLAALDLAARHGDALRDTVAGLWLDSHVDS